MSVINTNVMSLNAQRNLSTNSADLGTTIQRLSSGLRINSAKDDAAGLAISERFTTQIRGMDQAARNANDGISLAQTAEGALGEIGNNLQRIRELAVQSSNATNSADDRAALQKEVDQLSSEIQRVAEQTDFNGTKLLDGSFSGQAFQVGANAGQLISIENIANAQASALGGTTFATATGTVAAGVGDGGTDTADNAAGYGAINVAAFSINGVDFDAIDIAASAEDAFTGADEATAVTAATLAGTKATGQAVMAAINAKSAEAGVVASMDETTGAITISSTSAGKVGDQITTDLANVTATAIDATTAQKFVGDVDISNFAGAQQAISIMDSALTAVNSSRADLGAIQNRFSSVVTNLQTGSENLSAARSRIMDADYAKETANLSRTQILQQAGTAMLAQANQSSQSVLSLLR